MSWHQNELIKYIVGGGQGGGDYISRSGLETWMNGFAPDAASLAGEGSKEVSQYKRSLN